MSAPMPGHELRAVLMGEHKGLSDNRKYLRRLPSPLGDVVNTTARLASLAGPGEFMVSVPAAEAAGEIASDAERRTLEVRGREATIDVVVLRPAGS